MIRADHIRTFFQQAVDAGRLAGAVLLLQQAGQPIIDEHVGYRDLEAGDPIRQDTLFRIDSLTKPIASAAAMMLAERGLLRLSDPVAATLPELGRAATLDAPDRPCTISVLDLLRHTSGYTYGFLNDTPADRMYLDAKLLNYHDTLAHLVEKLAALPLKWPPGSRWEYGFSTDVLARIVEIVSGRPFDAFCREQIFAPLNMPNTDYGVPRTERHRIAILYECGDDGRCVRSPLRNPPDVGEAPVLKFGSGGLWSTARDYARFAQMLLNGGSLDGKRFLAPKTVALMTRDHLGDRPRNVPFSGLLDGCGFGLGVAVRVEPAVPPRRGEPGEYFWLGIGGPYFWADPSCDLVGVLMLQQRLPLDIHQEVRALVYEALDE